jgi:hypothetical protein
MNQSPAPMRRVAPAPAAPKAKAKMVVKSLSSAKPAPKKVSPVTASNDDWEEF